MNKRTKSLRVSAAVRKAVLERDSFEGYPCCINCGEPGAHDMAHLIPRSLGGLGIPENIVNLCQKKCHHNFDRTSERENILLWLEMYMREKYENWDEIERVYKK